MKRFCLLLAIWVFFGSRVFAQRPIEAPETLPFYNLTSIRLVDGRFGKPVMVCKYERTRSGKGHYSVEFVAKTEDGKLRVVGSSRLHRASGEISLSKMGISRGRDREYNYEIYLATKATWAGKSVGPIMVSNTARLGNPGEPTIARPLNKEERAAYQKHILDAKPPAAKQPDDYELATLSTKLVPGMYVVAGRYGQWKKAEFLGYTPNRKAKLRFAGETRIIFRPVENWIAATPADLARAKTDAASFKPSGSTLAAGKLLLPADAIPLAPSVKLVPGTPLLKEFGSRWEEVLFVERRATRLVTRMTSAPYIKQAMSYGELAIKESIVDQLKRPDSKAKFASNFEGTQSMFPDMPDFEFNFDDPAAMEQQVRNRLGGMPSRRSRRDPFGFDDNTLDLRDCEIESPVPKNCQIIPDDIDIPKGTKVAACFHFDWSSANVIDSHDDGTLSIDWHRHANAFNCRVRRDQLIIQKRDLTKIKRAAKKVTDLDKTPRIWTDATGQHKVKATVVKTTEQEVTLRMESGREKVLPIARLSKEDQELLRKFIPTDNPFAP